MRLLWVLALSLNLFCGHTQAGAQTLDRQQTETFSSVPMSEKAFLLKSVENELDVLAKKMMADPENARDGFLWARKVMGVWYFELSKNAAEIGVPELAGVYMDRAAAIGKNVRGELSADGLLDAIKRGDKQQQEFLDRTLGSAAPSPSPHFKEIPSVAREIARKIHTRAVLRDL